MINKMNNVSFKSVYYTPSINFLSEKNKAKVEDFAFVANLNFPNNDIFLASDPSGELYMRAQKSNPLHKLADTEIAALMKMSLPELVELINLTTAFKSAHNKVWGIQESYVLDQTKNLNDMDSSEVAFQFGRTIDIFNKTHKEAEN